MRACGYACLEDVTGGQPPVVLLCLVSRFARPFSFGQPLLHDFQAVEALFVEFGDPLQSFAC